MGCASLFHFASGGVGGAVSEVPCDVAAEFGRDLRNRPHPAAVIAAVIESTSAISLEALSQRPK
jgi:hypothetical protein